MDYTAFNGKRIMITGASGLIGRSLVAALIKNSTAKIVALVRNEQKAKTIFAGLPQDRIEYYVSDVTALEPKNISIDYVVHAANQTASKAFIEHPVEVIESSIAGTRNVLEFAKVNAVESFVYLSTMEVYGAPSTSDKIYETSPAYLDSTAIRSSYPESKRVCECLCAAYFAEYGVPAKIVRLTQTFGEGVEYSDKRVFAEFARCAIGGRDVVLKTKGETERNYLYVGDAVTAILTVLLHGKNGEAYNAANEETYCSIAEIAESVAANFGDGKVKVVIEDNGNAEKLGYAPVLKMNLATDKLRALGWEPEVGLTETFARLIDYMKKDRHDN